MSCFSEDGVAGAMIFLSQGLGDWEGEDRLDVEGDLIPSTIEVGFCEVGTRVETESRRSCSTNEGSVIMEISSDRFDLRSKVPLEWITFPSKDIGIFFAGGE